MASKFPVTLWINGALCPRQEARISPYDQGFLSGHGVFETLLARRGTPLAVTRHWKRLTLSCAMLLLPTPSLNTFRSALQEVLQASGLEEARLRFTVTGGEAAGFAMSRAILDEAELLLLAVRPAMRRRGVGRQLLRSAMAEARRRDVARMHLKVRAGNEAIAVYRLAGFEKIGERRNYYRGLSGKLFDAQTFQAKLI